MADKKDLAEQLLGLAREDLAAAQALDKAEGVSDSKSGFNAQQAVEKALKAALARQGEDFPFTHDIALLIELCEDHGLQLPADFVRPIASLPTPLRFAMAWAILAPFHPRTL